MIRRLLPLCAAALLAACSGEKAAPPSAARPALWEITGPSGEREGWLFGTVHALPDDFDWRSMRLERSLAEADMLVVEVANLGNDGSIGRIFEDIAYNRADGPVADRIDPALRDEFEALVVKAGVRRNYFDTMESWAAALALAQVGQDGDAGNGVDLALIKDFKGREIVELEGARRQLAIFDSLPEKEQRDLLNAVLAESAEPGDPLAEMALSWRKGDTAQLARLTGRGILADKELREVLLLGRNRAWAAQIENLLSAQAKPFIAVGAGHLLGPDGLPAMLEKDGYKVRRIQ